MSIRPRVFTIPASQPFLPTLIAALVEGRLVPGFGPSGDPLALSSATLYLPTRRACRLARDLFLEALPGDAAILPRIVPIGDPDEDEIAFDAAANAETLAVPEALGGLERQMLLTALTLRFAKQLRPDTPGAAPLVAGHPAAAFALAGDLARLMDDMTTRQVPWSRLDDLVPTEVDHYWQLTLSFLKIARDVWPALLEAHGRIEPAARRDALIAAETQRLARHPGPVIAAGSTGSMPATAMLLDAVARLPQGAVVLPGLDTDLDADAWQAIAGGDTDEPAPTHPQFALAGLLRRFGLARDEVEALTPPASYGRERLMSEAMRPAAQTEHWPARLAADGFATHANTALAGVTLIEAATAEEEALAIAVALREAIETPGRTAALVTPDRALARRVLAALARWTVAVDDSGGDALTETPDGVFARLVAEAGLKGLEPVTLLAMLKHPLSRFEAQDVSALEQAVLRGPRPRPGCAGLRHALDGFRVELAKLRAKDPSSSLHRSEARARLADGRLDRASHLVDELARALAPLERLRATPMPFGTLAAAHRAAIEALGAIDETLATAFDEIEAHGALAIAPADYPELFVATLAGRVVRRPEADVRVRIYGPLEARLQHVDCLVVGGLVEGVWPPDTRADPWLSRPMRHALGLDLPERRIGLSAHDFAQAMGAPQVILTRAAKLGGAPTVPARFLQRLAAVAGPARWDAAIARGATHLAFARALDEPATPRRAPRPEPKPPLDARPTSLSVTEIEHLLRDPYTIYAKHVLRLAPLPAIDTPPGAADRGNLIHGAIGDFAAAFPAALPADPAGEMIRFGERRFVPLADYPEARAFWWPRVVRIAHWLAGFERERRADIATLHTEIAGTLTIPLGDGEFTLRVRADRIEHLADGSYAILDFKTGSPPTERQVRVGLSPQLTLEAAILRRGGFDAIPAGGDVSELTYVRLRGGDPAGEACPITFKGSSANAEGDRALEKLTRIVAHFASPDAAYLSLVHPMWKARYGDYDHLARVKEWSLTGGLAEDAE